MTGAWTQEGRPLSAALSRLAEQVRAIERSGRKTAQRRISIASGDLDQLHAPKGRQNTEVATIPRLAIGRLHEWIGLFDPSQPREDSESQEHHFRGRGHFRGWVPPLLILAHLARQALGTTEDDAAPHRPHLQCVLWIGRRVHPHPRILAGRAADNRALLERSLFIDPPDHARHVWAIDLALRCPAIAAVIADGSGLSLPHTRRLQLAAEQSNALALLVRPPHQRTCRSVAATRWLVHRARSPGDTPRWRITLARCKDMQRSTSARNAQTAWLLEWDRETACLRAPSDMVDRPLPASTKTPARIAIAV